MGTAAHVFVHPSRERERILISVYFVVATKTLGSSCTAMSRKEIFRKHLIYSVA